MEELDSAVVLPTHLSPCYMLICLYGQQYPFKKKYCEEFVNVNISELRWARLIIYDNAWCLLSLQATSLQIISTCILVQILTFEMSDLKCQFKNVRFDLARNISEHFSGCVKYKFYAPEAARILAFIFWRWQHSIYPFGGEYEFFMRQRGFYKLGSKLQTSFWNLFSQLTLTLKT